MTAHVPLRAPRVQRNQVLNGRVVRAPTWRDIALCANFTHGRGAQLVPDASGTSATLAAGSEHHYSFRVHPTFQTFDRLWIINAHGSTDPVNLLIKAPASGGTEKTYPVHGGTGERGAILYLEHLSSQAAALTNLTLSIKPETGGDTAVVDSIGCVEVPRLSLSTTSSDLGFDLTKTSPSTPILADDGGTDIELNRIADQLATYASTGRRVGHWAWSVPYLVGGSESTSFAKSTTASSGTPDTMFPLDVPMLARPTSISLSTGTTDTLGELEWWALVKCSDGTTSGTIQMDATSGSSVTLTIPTSTTAWTWIAADDVLEVDTEDQTASDGRRSTRWDDCTATWWRTAGTGTVYCAGLLFHESG